MKKRMTFTLDSDMLDELKEISNETMIPQARLVEKAIKNIIKEYEK